MKRTKYLSIIAGLCLLLAPQTARAAEAEKGIDVAGIVFGHIEDSYEWHITDVGDVSVHIPLPVIVKSSTGWHVFSSDRLKDGAEAGKDCLFVERRRIRDEYALPAAFGAYSRLI